MAKKKKKNQLEITSVYHILTRVKPELTETVNIQTSILLSLTHFT